jgi:heptosyltransferase-2
MKERKLPANPDRILIIRFSSIGDIILTFPTLYKLKELYPDAEIDFLIGKEYQEILQIVRPLVNKIILYDKRKDSSEIKRIKNLIRRNKYDFIVDLQGNIRSFRVCLNEKTKVYKIKKYRFRRFLYIYFKLKVYPEIPVYQKYLRTISVNENLESFPPNNYYNKEINKKLNIKIPFFSDKFPILTVFPGAKHFTKRWPLKYFEEVSEMVLKRTNWNIIFAGDKVDAEYISKMPVFSNPRVFNATGKYRLLESIVLIQKSNIILSNDSAPMHISALFSKPQVAIFGGTTPQLGFAPLSPNALVIENEKLKCRPCSHIGRAKCPKKHFKCMKEITAEMVYENLLIGQRGTILPKETTSLG